MPLFERLCDFYFDILNAIANTDFFPNIHVFSDHMDGFDACMVVRETEKPSNVWNIIFQMKHSMPESSSVFTQSSLADKKRKLRGTELHYRFKKAGAVRFIYVIVAWRTTQASLSHLQDSGDPPLTVLILNRSTYQSFILR